MHLDAEIENKIRARAIHILRNGREEWDVPHTLACVYWIKEILKHERGNAKIIIPAVYLHDIAYGILAVENTRSSVMNLKKEHMKEGARMSREILKEIGGFSEEEVERVAFLVGTHDKLDELTTHDQQLVFEADSLGQIDRDRVKPTFSKEDAQLSLERFKLNRAPRFKTETGKKFLSLLMHKAEKYNLSL